MVTRDEVVDAFRFLLGRDPENIAVVDKFLPVPNWRNLRDIFATSDEFKAKLMNGIPAGTAPPDFRFIAPNAVDVEISPEHFDQLMTHVQASWEALGKQQPHWSVLTNPSFLPENIDANVQSFYDTGRRSVQILEMAGARASRELPPRLTCFELGCGVGRVTSHLAEKFKRVVAADISAPHLALAMEHLRKKCLDNVMIVQLKSLTVLENIEPFDVFYSIIVLQHNPPPLIYRMLDIILGKIKRDGFLYFQVPVSRPDYSFSIENYMKAIRDDKAQMEMHTLPQTYLFRLLDEHGFRTLDLQHDSWAGSEYQSVTVFAERK